MKKQFIRTSQSDSAFAVSVPAILWQIVFFYLPLSILLISSFLQFSDLGEFERITISKLTSFFTPLYLRVIFDSILLGLGNALLCFCIAYPLSYFLAFGSKKYSTLFLFLLIVPFWTNFLLHVYAWFFVLEKEGFLNNLLINLGVIGAPIHFLNSLFSITIMMVYYYLPFMVLPIYSSLGLVDRRLVEASLDLGATWLQTVRKILLPLSWQGIRTGFFLVYIPSFAEFAIPELMGGNKQMFVGNVISLYLLGEETGEYGASFTVVSILFLFVSTVALYYLLRFLILGRQKNG